MKLFTFLFLFIVSGFQSTKAQINFTPSLNYTIVSNYDDDSILYHCNDTMFTVENDTLVINKLYDPGSGCPYEFKFSPLINDTMYVRFSFAPPIITCTLDQPLHCVKMKVIPMAAFTSIHLKFLGNLDYNDSTTGIWYHITNLSGGVSFTPSFPLPNEEFSIHCNSSETGNLISWYCDMNQIQSYSVEKSPDGVTFSEMTTINAVSKQYNYSWSDKNRTTNCYYRIRKADIDGHIEYSKTCYLRRTNMPESIYLYPNPLEGKALNISFQNCLNKNYIMTVTDMVGRIIHKEFISVASNSFLFSREIKLASGSFMNVVLEDTESHEKTDYRVFRGIE